MGRWGDGEIGCPYNPTTPKPYDPTTPQPDSHSLFPLSAGATSPTRACQARSVQRCPIFGGYGVGGRVIFDDCVFQRKRVRE